VVQLALALLLELITIVGDPACSLDEEPVGPGLAGRVSEHLRYGRV
jgi:hypothetical protein